MQQHRCFFFWTLLFYLLIVSAILPGRTCHAAAVNLPRTGINKCYTPYYGEKSCTNTGQDGDWQAGIAWPDPRFTDNADGTITDHLTGLMWKAVPQPPQQWYLANQEAKALVFAGYSDWRVPNINEYLSLNRHGHENIRTWLNDQGFELMDNNVYHTSNHKHPRVLAADMGYTPSYSMGFGVYAFPDTIFPYLVVRGDSTGPARVIRTQMTTCVVPVYDENGKVVDFVLGTCADTGQDGEYRKGAAWPSPRYVDEGDGTVTDNLTGLMWLKDANCMKTHYPEFDNYYKDPNPGNGGVGWDKSLDFINQINDGIFDQCGAGYTDWRLPNLKELASMVDYSRAYLDQGCLQAGHPFENIAPLATNNSSDRYHSSTMGVLLNDPGDAERGLGLDISDGYLISNPGGSSEVREGFVWPVRLGHVSGLWLSAGPYNPEEKIVRDDTAPVDVLQLSLSNNSYPDGTVKVSDLTFHYEGSGNRARVSDVALFRQTDCALPGSGDPCLGTGQFSQDGTITFAGVDEVLAPGETRCYSLRYSLTAMESGVTYKAKIELDDMVADLDPPGEPLRIGGNTVKGSVKPPPPPQFPKSGEVQDPIDTGTGSYFFNTIDLSLGGPMPLFFSRSYASIKNKEAFFWSYLGDRWRQNHYIRLNVIDDTHVEIHLQNDQKLDFEKQASEWHLVPEQDIHYQYQQGAEGGHYLLDPDCELVYIFDDQAWLTHVMDRNGNRHTYLRDDEDRIVEISDGLGRAFVVSYDDPDRSWRFKEVAIQGTGAKIRFEYDEYDRLIRFTDPEGHVTGYTYDDDRSTGSSLITRVTPGRGNAPYAQVYDTDEGRVQQQIDAYDNATDLVYDINGRTTITYPDGTVQEHAHRFGSLLTEAVDPRNNPISLDHDLTGHITSMTGRTGGTTQISYHEPSGKIASMTNAWDDVLSYTYTDQDQTFSDPDTQDSVTFTFYNLTRIDYPDGTFETFSHDGKGNILEHIDPAGNSWTYTYNDHGQVLTATNPEGGVTICTYNADATLASTTDSDTGTTLYAYDGYKRLTQITHPDNTIIQIAYDLSNQVTAVTDGRGNTHAYAYDANGNLTSITDPDTRQTLFTRDLMDRINETTNARGKKSRHVYDHMNRLQSIIDPNANTVQYGYSDRGRLEKITDGSGYEWTTNFDNEGLPISDTTPMGRTTSIVRDSLGYITQIKNPLNEETLLTRDEMSRITRVTDPLDRITRYTYDHAGRLTGVTLPDGTAATYRRNGLGLVDRITDLKGSQWLLNYTAMGRLSTLTDPLNNQWQYGYDERGRLNQILYPDGTTQTRTLDNAGNLLRSRYSPGPELNFTYDTQNRLLTADHIEFTYNETGQVTATTDSGTAFGATYDDGGRLESVSYNNAQFSVTYTHDARNLLTRVTDSLTGTAIDFSYDNDGLLTAVTRPGGADSSFTWDDASRLTRIQHGTLADLQYTYNAAGEVTGIDYDLPLDPADYQVTATENLNHDVASQIITPGYSFDDLGRRITGSGQTFTWDGASRLTATSDAILTYNGLNNLLTRQKSGTTTHYFYNYALGLHPVVAEYNETTSTWKRFYVLTPDGTLLYAIDPASGNAVTFYHFDKGGNTLFLSNAAGAITDTYAYSPYGRLLAHEGTSDQPFTFGGAWGVRQENAEGLYQMRARYYHAATSRFISREPLWPQLHNAVALNNYQYADADPIQSIDPTGLSAQQKIKVGFSVSPDVKKSFYHEAVKGMTESASIKKGGESLSNGSKYGVFQTEGKHTTEVDYSVIIKGSDNEVVAEIRNNLTGESMVAGALAVDYIKRGVPEGPGANPGEVTRNYGTNWILVNFVHQIQDELRNFLDLTTKIKDPVDTGGSDQVQEASAARHMGKGEAIEKLQKFTPVKQSSKQKSILKTE